MNFILLQTPVVAPLLAFVASLTLSLLIFFLLRGVLLWYWKVDKVLENQQKQIQQQQTIIEGLSSLYKSINNNNNQNDASPQ